MFNNHHRIVGFRVSCFFAFFTPLPCHEKMCVFSSGNFPAAEKEKSPRRCCGGGPATKQAKGKSHADAWLLLSECDKKDTLF